MKPGLSVSESLPDSLGNNLISPRWPSFQGQAMPRDIWYFIHDSSMIEDDLGIVCSSWKLNSMNRDTRLFFSLRGTAMLIDNHI